MVKIVLGSDALEKLRTASESVEVCDASGLTLGFFTPLVDSSRYKGVEPPTTEAELQRREQTSTGRTLPEIMSDLEKGK